MRIVYIVVIVIGMAALLADHFSSRPGGRAVPAANLTGDCAPCPSVEK